MKIMVNHEWGTLKEVVVGCPFGRIGTDIPGFVRNYIPSSVIAYVEEVMKAFPGKKLEDVEKNLYETLVNQIDNIISILKKRGIIVHQIKPFEPFEENYLKDISFNTSLQMFPRDPMLVIGNTFIETAMYSSFRRKERFPIRRTISHLLTENDFVSMPEPLPVPEGPDGYGPGVFLEGGDVFLLGRNIYVGNTVTINKLYMHTYK